MLTDAELDALARDVVTETISYLNRSGNPPFSAVRKTDAGDPLIVYADGSGVFTSEYSPLNLVKKIIRVCERYYDVFEVNAKDTNTGEQKKLSLDPIRKDHWVGNMAANATVILISQFRSELLLTLDETLEDCYLVAAAYLASGVGKNLSMQSGQAIGDATDAIEKAVKRVSSKKRDKLRFIMKELPNLIIEHSRGGARNIKHVWSDTDRNCLATKYAELQPIWIEAKKIARIAQNSTEATRKREWRKEVLAVYDLPPDLLERFATLRADDAKPSDIAVLHAARLCLPPNVELSIARLRQELTAWKIKPRS